MSGFHDLPSDEQVRAELATVRAEVLEATRRVHSPRLSSRSRTTIAVILAGAVAAALTAGTIAATRANEQRISSEVTCYEHASLDSRQQVILSGSPDESSADDFDPAETCGLMWRNDLWSETSNNDPDDPNDGDAPVPPLAACVLMDGTAGVFPLEGSTASADDFCAALGLAEWDSD